MTFYKSNVALLFLVWCFATISSSNVFAASPCQVDEAKFQGTVASNEKPVVGANLLVFRKNKLLTKSVTDDEGKFSFALDSNESIKILIVAEGMISQVRALAPTKNAKFELEEQAPKDKLKARIIDSQGVGVAEAQVKVITLRVGEFTVPIPEGFELISLRTMSDEKGWFQFPEIAPTLIGQIQVTCSGIVPATLTGDSFKNVPASGIILVAQPARSVVGTVVDRTSKQPIGDVVVTSSMSGTRAEVDESGRFEMNGLPAFEPLQLVANANGGQPYHSASVPVPVGQGFAGAEVKIELNPGVWVNCNVKDFVTGQPSSARVYYFPTPENKKFQAFIESFRGRGVPPAQQTDSSGKVRLVAVSGPGVVVVVAPGFPSNETVNKLTDEQRAMLTQFAGPELTDIKWISPKDLNDEIEASFVVSKGRTIDVELEGKDFVSTDQFVLHRAASKNSFTQTVQGPKFVAEQFHPGETRQVLIHEPQKGLGAVLELKADAKSPVTVKLDPTGSVMGQLVDKGGEPQRGILVKFEISSDGGFQEIATQVFTDANGRFEKPSLIATLDYRVSAIRPTKNMQMMMTSPAVDSRWDLAKDLKINSNEMVDLGSIELGAKDQAEPKRMLREEMIAKDDSFPSLITGVVEGESGEPVSNAKITFNTWPNRTGDLAQDIKLEPIVLAQARSDSSGNFQISIGAGLKEKLVAASDGGKNAALVVVAEKLGAIQVPIDGISDSTAVKLKLNREMVIRGRANGDSDSQKISLVCGAPIRVYDVKTLEKFMASLKEGGSLESALKTFEPVTTLDPVAGGPPLEWVTSSSGAFLVRNVPINGIFELHAFGESGQEKTILVVSRPTRGFEIILTDDLPEKIQLQGSRIKLKLSSDESAK